MTELLLDQYHEKVTFVKVIINGLKYKLMSKWELLSYLRKNGIDTNKPFQIYENDYGRIYIVDGYGLPEKTVGIIKTVVGVIPIKQK